MNERVLKRFIIYLAILTFVMFTVWALIRSFSNRPPGDYETTVCDNRLKDKEYNKAINNAINKAINNGETHLSILKSNRLVSKVWIIPYNEGIDTIADYSVSNWVDDWSNKFEKTMEQLN